MSVISIAEIRKGVERMQKGVRRDRISTWLREDLPLRFENRILPVDLAVAQQWGVSIERARDGGFSLRRWMGFWPRLPSSMDLRW
jgi:hypothetical protein